MNGKKRTLLSALGLSEVDDLELRMGIVGEKQILRFNVTMGDSFTMDMGKC